MTYQPIVHKSKVIDYKALCVFIENAVAIVLFSLLCIYPEKLEFLAIISFEYSFSCTVFSLTNPIGICMYFLGNAVLYIRGFFLRHTKKKVIISIVIGLLMIFSEIRFGFRNAYVHIIDKLGYFLVLFVSALIVFIFRDTTDSSNKILNLADYAGLNEKDMAALNKVLENKQYKVIAKELSRTEGTVRNRLNKVYDILGVMDRMGFVSAYTGYSIVYDPATAKPEEL